MQNLKDIESSIGEMRKVGGTEEVGEMLEFFYGLRYEYTIEAFLDFGKILEDFSFFLL